MRQTSDISVLICAYRTDRWPDLQKAVASLQRQTLVPAEILLVIDNNPDLADRCRTTLKGVRVTENRGKQGISGARNTGIAEARGSFIAFLDDDAVAEPEWLERLAAPLTDPAIMGIGGASLPAWDGRAPRWFPEEFFWTVGCSYRGLPTTNARIRNVFGGTVIYRRDIFPVVGGFVSEIGRNHIGLISCEETEFCIRANQRFPDMYFVYEPTAIMFHRIPENRGRFGFFAKRCFDEGRSKAIVARFVGTDDALSEERSYTFRTLPTGIAKDIADALKHRDPWAVARAGAIVSGLSFTAVGYVFGVIEATITRPAGSRSARHEASHGL